MINGALRDLDQWREANKNTGDEEQNRQNKSLSKISIKDKLPPNSEYYCLVDASWKSSREEMHYKKTSTQLRNFTKKIKTRKVTSIIRLLYKEK